MGLIQLINILIARRWIILIALLVCVTVALGFAKTLPERYEARARLLLDVVKPDPVTGTLMGGQAARTYIRTQLELIQDYRIAGDVAEKLGWLENPDVIASWQSETGGAGEMRRWAAQRIINGTSANMIEGSNILEIVYQGPNPGVAKALVAKIREAYIDASLRFKTESAARSADWYREQTDRANVALTSAETAKSRFEQENGIVMGPSNSEAEAAKLAGLQSALIGARNGQPSQQFEATKLTTNSPVVDQLKMQAAAIDDQIAQAGERLGLQHPTYKALLARRALLNTQLSYEQSSARSSAAAQTGASAQAIAQLQAEYDAQKAKVLGMKDRLDRLSQLDREVEQRRDQYNKAVARTADLRLQANMSDSGLVVLGDAFATTKPTFPNIPLIGSLAAAFGLGIGVLLALLTELFARRVRGMEDLAFASKVPVVAVIADQARSPLRDRIRRLLTRKRSTTPDWQPAQ